MVHTRPKEWRVYDGGGQPQGGRASKLRQGLGDISRQYGAWRKRRALHRSTGRWVFWGLVAAVACGALVDTAKTWRGWQPMEIVRHIAAFPNCDAARNVGLAPARRGEPGYYLKHDRDKDGIACEVWPRK